MSILKSISEGFKLAISAKRIIPFLIINLIVFYSLTIFLGQIISFATLSGNPLALLSSLGMYIILFIIMALIDLWITGAITHQAKYPNKSLMDSFRYSTSKYLVIFASTILVGIIAVILSLPQYIGWLLALIWTLIIFYLYPAIIIGGKGAIGSFKETWNVFKKFPLETFVTWLLIGIISIIIVAVFTVPMIFYLIGSILSLLPMDESIYVNNTLTRNLVKTEILPKLIDAVKSPIFFVYFFIFCLGMSLQKVFSVCTKARLYINLKKGKKSTEEE